MEQIKLINTEVSQINSTLISLNENFVGGNLSNHLDSWTNLTSDKEVLNTIKGLKIDIDVNLIIKNAPKSHFSEKMSIIIDNEIEKLTLKQAITQCDREPNDFISPIFLKKKPDGSHRMILNLKRMNKQTKKIHFKMDTITSIMRLIRPNCYFTKVDLKDAY